MERVSIEEFIRLLNYLENPAPVQEVKVCSDLLLCCLCSKSGISDYTPPLSLFISLSLSFSLSLQEAAGSCGMDSAFGKDREVVTNIEYKKLLTELTTQHSHKQ